MERLSRLDKYTQQRTEKRRKLYDKGLTILCKVLRFVFITCIGAVIKAFLWDLFKD